MLYIHKYKYLGLCMCKYAKIMHGICDVNHVNVGQSMGKMVVMQQNDNQTYGQEDGCIKCDINTNIPMGCISYVAV